MKVVILFIIDPTDSQCYNFYTMVSLLKLRSVIFNNMVYGFDF